MFKRRLFGTIATVALVTEVLGAGQVRAQAHLGFTIDAMQGYPGDTVNGEVDVNDVAASCVTDLATFQGRFAALFDGPFAGGANSGDLFNRFFPTGDFVFENYDQAAYSLTGFVVLGIAADFNGAAETALPQTFVMTFASIVTQQPVGEVGHFDPTTGAGSVVVPNVAPGLWAVAAACVGPSLDVDFLEAGIRANGAFLQSIGMPTPDINSAEFAAWIEDYLFPGATEEDFLNAIGPTLVQNIVTPDALGLQLFTIPQCGNGAVELGEQCDDGNTANGDCCDSTCQFELATAPCDDGDACTQGDVCDGAGTCAGPTPTECDDGDACTADSCDPIDGCVNDAAPASGCLTATHSIMLLKNASDDSKDKLLWKWIKGAELDQTDLADPTNSTNYALCVYAGTTNTLVADAALPPGPGWSAVGTKGYKFKGTSPDGLTNAILKGGAAGKSKAFAKGKGAALPDPMLPLAYPVTVQLKKDGSPLCLESTFTSANEKKNTATQFKAKQ